MILAIAVTVTVTITITITITVTITITITIINWRVSGPDAKWLEDHPGLFERHGRAVFAVEARGNGTDGVGTNCVIANLLLCFGCLPNLSNNASHFCCFCMLSTFNYAALR